MFSSRFTTFERCVENQMSFFWFSIVSRRNNGDALNITDQMIIVQIWITIWKKEQKFRWENFAFLFVLIDLNYLFDSIVFVQLEDLFHRCFPSTYFPSFTIVKKLNDCFSLSSKSFKSKRKRNWRTNREEKTFIDQFWRSSLLSDDKKKARVLMIYSIYVWEKFDWLNQRKTWIVRSVESSFHLNFDKMAEEQQDKSLFERLTKTICPRHYDLTIRSDLETFEFFGDVKIDFRVKKTFCFFGFDQNVFFSFRSTKRQMSSFFTQQI